MRKYRQMILAILLTVILLGLAYWAGQDKQKVRRIQIVVLKQTIPAGTLLKPEHLAVVELPENPALAGYLNDPGQAIGLWSQHRTQIRGNVLLAARAVPEASGVTFPNPRPGRRLMTLELKSGDANGYYLAAGNRIDLHLVPKQLNETATETIRNVPVIAVLGTNGQILEMPLDKSSSTSPAVSRC